MGGIKVSLQNYVKNEVKMSMYADDITVFLTDVFWIPYVSFEGIRIETKFNKH